jgi:flavin reductase (DIM6/NTAB) family NADH-FMN oxidoreductase RutF
MTHTAKVNIGSYPFVYPIPVVLVGAEVAGEPNFETVGNCSIAGFNPGYVFIASVRSHYTNRGIIANGTFSVNVPTAAMTALVDFCGIASGRDYAKADLFTTFSGSLGTAPMIEECPVAMECRVIHHFSHGAMDMFIGEVVGTYVDQRLAEWVADPRPEAATDAGHWRRRKVALAELDPVVFNHDNLYYATGAVVGRGYHDGKQVTLARRVPAADEDKK